MGCKNVFFFSLPFLGAFRPVFRSHHAVSFREGILSSQVGSVSPTHDAIMGNERFRWGSQEVRING